MSSAIVFFFVITTLGAEGARVKKRVMQQNTTSTGYENQGTPESNSQLISIQNWFSMITLEPVVISTENYHGSWRFVSVDKTSGELKKLSEWSHVPYGFGNGGYNAVLGGVFPSETLLVMKTKATSSVDGVYTFSTCSSNGKCSDDVVRNKDYRVGGSLDAVYGLLPKSSDGTGWTPSTVPIEMDVYSVDSPSAEHKKLATLRMPEASDMVADYYFSGDADNVYVLLSASAESQAGISGSFFNSDLWRVPRNGEDPQKWEVSKRATDYFDSRYHLFDGVQMLSMLKIPGGGLVIAAQKHEGYISGTNKFQNVIYEVDLDSGEWTIKISGDEFGTPIDGKCSAYDASTHTWYIGCELMAVVDLKTMKVVHRIEVETRKPVRGTYSLSSTTFF